MCVLETLAFHAPCTYRADNFCYFSLRKQLKMRWWLPLQFIIFLSISLQNLATLINVFLSKTCFSWRKTQFLFSSTLLRIVGHSSRLPVLSIHLWKISISVKSNCCFKHPTALLSAPAKSSLALQAFQIPSIKQFWAKSILFVVQQRTWTHF